MKNLVLLSSALNLLIILSCTVFAQPVITQLTPTPTENTINSIKKIPGTNKLIALGENSTMMLSPDGGENWIKSTFPEEFGYWESLKQVHFINSNTGIICGYNMFKTTDGGDSWVQVNGYSTFNQNDITFSTNTTGFCIGENGTMLQSTNSGESWDYVSLGVNFELNAIDFCNQNIGFIVGESVSEVLKTTNGGSTWNIVSIVPAYINSSLKDIHFVNETTGYLTMHDLSGLSGSYGRIYKTENQGTTWTEVFSISSFLPGAIDFYDEQNGMTICKNDENEIKILYTNDGGVTWNESELPLTSYPPINTICYFEENIALVGGYYGQLYKTIDAGVSWVEKYERTFYSDYNSMQFVNDSVGYFQARNAFNQPHALFKTSDKGENWAVISSPNVFSIDFISTEIGYGLRGVNSDLYVLKTIDGGYNWSEVSTFSSDGISYQLNMYDEMNGLITSTMGSFYKTADGGLTWSVVGGGGPLPWNITYKNANDVYLIGWDGNATTQLRKSTNGGSTWTTFNLGQYGHGYELTFVNDNLAFITVMENVILKSTNGGDSWYETTINNSNEMGVVYLSFPSEQVGYGVGYSKFIRTTDSGETWDLVSTIPDHPSAIHFFDNNHGLIAGHNGSLLKVAPFEFQNNPPLNFYLNTIYNQGLTQFILSWNLPDPTNAPELSGFNIYRNDTLLTTVGPAILSYNETLEFWPGFDEICYSVSALYLNPSGESEQSEVLCEPFLEPLQFNPPLNFDLTSEFSGETTQFLLSWEEPDTINSAELAGYNIYRNDSLLLILDPSNLNYYETLNYWPGFDEMCYAVSANYIYPTGESEKSDTLCEPFMEPLQFNPPVNFELQTVYWSGPTEFHLFWEPPDLTNTPELSGYNVYRNDTLLVTLSPDFNEFSETLNPFGWSNLLICYKVSALYQNPSGESNPTVTLCDWFLTAQEELDTRSCNFYAIPNPFHNLVTFHFKFFENESAEIVMIDITGKTLHTFAVDVQMEILKISTDHLKPGVYFYHLKTESGITETKKMIKL
jgi:photosystem II stability/assembly factor-like uncharacterized protein